MIIRAYHTQGLSLADRMDVITSCFLNVTQKNLLSEISDEWTTIKKNWSTFQNFRDKMFLRGMLKQKILSTGYLIFSAHLTSCDRTKCLCILRIYPYCERIAKFPPLLYVRVKFILCYLGLRYYVALEVNKARIKLISHYFSYYGV